VPGHPVWSAVESEDTARAVRQGLNELSDFFATRPAAVFLALGGNAWSASSTLRNAANTEWQKTLCTAIPRGRAFCLGEGS